MTITITSRCFSLYARTREGWLKKRPETRVVCKEALKSRTGKRIDWKRRSSVIREGWGLIPSAFGRNGALFSHSSQPSTASITLTAPWSVRAITGCSGSRTSRGNRSNRSDFLAASRMSSGYASCGGPSPSLDGFINPASPASEFRAELECIRHAGVRMSAQRH